MHEEHHRSSRAGRVVLLALGSLVLAYLAVFPSIRSIHLLYPQEAGCCSSLPGRDSQLCSSYQTAVGPDKFTAAAHWRQLSPSTYACSGITVDCLQVDMHSSSAGSSCQPLEDGEPCDEELQLTCGSGFCGGRPSRVDPFDPNFIPGASHGFAPVSFGPAQPQPRPQPQGILSRAKSLVTSLLYAAADDDDHQVSLQPAPRSLQRSSLGGADPSWPTAYGIVKFREAGRRVPDTFLATSHEWTRVADYGTDNAQAWAEIFKVLSPSPVLRIGGATQDKLVDVPKDETWVALAKLQKLTNARFIIGLPLFQKNAVEMSRQMIGQAKKYLGSSVIGFELGNEPEFWPNGLGGYDEQGNWKAGFGPYTQWFDRVAKTLNPCGTSAFLSGPGWGNVNTQDPSWLRTVLTNGKACGYLWEANTHYYPYINNATVTAEQLLAQPLQDFGVERFKTYVKIAEGQGLPLRISEANSLYGGGRADLSDTMAGTLWVADALFAFANAGARAFHMHWGFGGLPYQGGSPNVGVQTNFDYNTPYPYKPYPSVHAPWYAYLFWVSATAGGYSRNSDTQFVSAWIERQPPANSKSSSSSSSSSGSSSNSSSSSGAPASVVTEKGNRTTTSSSSNSTSSGSNRRMASPDAVKAWNLQTSTAGDKRAQHKAVTAVPQTARAGLAPAKLTAAAQTSTPTKKVPARRPAAGTVGAVVQKGHPAAAVQQKGRRLLDVGQCDANIKIWALKAGDSTLRVVLVNKDASKSCNVRVSIPDASHLCKEGQKAELSRLLPGSQGMSSKSGLSWQGQHYDDASVASSGKLVGDRTIEMVSATKDADGCAYVVGMAKTSAALLVIKP